MATISETAQALSFWTKLVRRAFSERRQRESGKKWLSSYVAATTHLSGPLFSTIHFLVSSYLPLCPWDQRQPMEGFQITRGKSRIRQHHNFKNSGNNQKSRNAFFLRPNYVLTCLCFHSVTATLEICERGSSKSSKKIKRNITR